MVGKSMDGVIDKLNNMSLSDHIDTVRKYNLGVSYFPNKKEIIDRFFNVGDQPFTIKYSNNDVEKIYDTNNKIIKNIYDEICHSQYNMSYHKLQKVFLYKLSRKYVIDTIIFWCEELGIDKEEVFNGITNDDSNIFLVKKYHRLVNEKEYESLESIISDLIGYYDKNDFKELSKKVIIDSYVLPKNYLDE